MLYLIQSKICKVAVFHSGRRLFSSERRWFYFAKAISNTISKAAGRTSPQKGRPGRNPAAILKNERGNINYFSMVVFIFVAVLLLAFILNLFSYHFH